ncbi:MAG: hypothetical protein LH645_06965 [Actinomycetia bacterium]|nr:hypothetical protein [Actinomycetes bacterium]
MIRSKARRPVALLVAPFVAMALVASAGVGFALGLARPPTEQPPGTGWFARWVDDAGDDTVTELTATAADEQLSRRGQQTLSGANGALKGVPFESFDVRLARSDRPDAGEVRSGRFQATAIVEYRLPLDEVLVGRTAAATFRLGPNGWRLVRLNASGRDLWDHEPVDVTENGQTLVMARRGDLRLPGLGTLAEQARREVADFWSARWPQTTVVVLPSTPRLLDPLAGLESGSDQVAVTLWATGSEGPVIRVLMNPTVYDQMPTLARKIVLRHEITHVAQNALPRDGVPTWLKEGLADYVSYRGSGIPDSFVGAQLLAKVRATGVPEDLPDDSEFDLDRASADRRVAYQSGWAFCQMVADAYGDDRLVPFYAAVARGEGSTDERLNDAADEVLGTTFDDLRVQWQSWLTANA